MHPAPPRARDDDDVSRSRDHEHARAAPRRGLGAPLARDARGTRVSRMRGRVSRMRGGVCVSVSVCGDVRDSARRACQVPTPLSTSQLSLWLLLCACADLPVVSPSVSTTCRQMDGAAAFSFFFFSGDDD